MYLPSRNTAVLFSRVLRSFMMRKCMFAEFPQICWWCFHSHRLSGAAGFPLTVDVGQLKKKIFKYLRIKYHSLFNCVVTDFKERKKLHRAIIFKIKPAKNI